jgi:hypothetical protein
MKQKIDKSCGCLIEDILGESSEKSKDKQSIEFSKNSDRLCPTSAQDIKIFVDPDVEKISLDFYRKKYTDGLPIVPPTMGRVKKFFQYSTYEPQKVLGILPPRQGKATIEKIAINGVMAGCLPFFMPVLEKAVLALSRPQFNLAGVNATTHPVAICTLVNGSISQELEMNTESGCLGPGNLANATIGRAMRLCLINIAGAIPGIGDHATIGSPAKYSYCFAENEKDKPWEPLHVERGFPKESSAVTVLGMEAPHNVNDHRSKTAEGVLDTIVHTLSTAGCNNSHVPGELLVIMSPEHTETVAGDGWAKEDVKNYIHEKALVPVELADRGGRLLDKKWVRNNMVSLTRSPDDVILVVAGGPGRHTMVAHGFGTSCESVTEGLVLKDGSFTGSVKDYLKK